MRDYLSRGLFTTTACAFAMSFGGFAHVAEADSREIITREEARERAEAEIDQWRERIKPGYPRIFFTPEVWDGLKDRFENAEGHERALFDAVIEHGQDLAQQEIQEYRTPEEMVTARNALLSAQAELWQRPIGDDLVNASLALALNDDPELREHIRQTVLMACTYPNWGLRSRGMHLASSHMSRGIAIAYDWHPDIWTEEEKETIRETIHYHVTDIAEGLYGGAFWARSYHNNHNHVSVSALALCGLAFLDEIPEAAEWLGGALINFERVIPANNEDGSSPEGLSYWGYSMRFILEYIEGTRHITGSDSLYEHPFLKNAISFRLHGATSGFEGPLPWGAVGGAASAPQSLYALARQYQDSRGQFLADQSPIHVNLRWRSGVATDIGWRTLWYDASLPSTAPETMDHHMTVADIVTTRSGWSEDDYLLTIKSGQNNRNHGHLDAGAIALAYGNEWILTAPRYGQGKQDGTRGYWSRSGEGRRWTYFSTTTEGHSTLVVNGKNQRWDPAARGTIDVFEIQDDWVWTGVDLIEAYEDVESIRREVLHRRGDYALVFDHARLKEPGSVEWLAQVLPAAEFERGEITVPNENGRVTVRSLLPEGASFAVREPTAAKHYDLPQSRLTSLRLIQDDVKEASYIVLILPERNEGENPVRDARIESAAGGKAIIVEGDGWTDKIVLGETEAHMRRTTEAGEDSTFTVKRK